MTLKFGTRYVDNRPFGVQSQRYLARVQRFVAGQSDFLAAIADVWLYSLESQYLRQGPGSTGKNPTELKSLEGLEHSSRSVRSLQS